MARPETSEKKKLERQWMTSTAVLLYACDTLRHAVGYVSAVSRTMNIKIKTDFPFNIVAFLFFVFFLLSVQSIYMYCCANSSLSTCLNILIVFDQAANVLKAKQTAVRLYRKYIEFSSKRVQCGKYFRLEMDTERSH